MIVCADQLSQADRSLYLFGITHVPGAPSFCAKQLDAFADSLQAEQANLEEPLILLEKAGSINRLTTPSKELLLDLEHEVRERHLTYEIQNIENRYTALAACFLLGIKDQADVPHLPFDTEETPLHDVTYQHLDAKFAEIEAQLQQWAHSHPEVCTDMYRKKLRDAAVEYKKFTQSLEAIQVEPRDTIFQTIPLLATLSVQKRDELKSNLSQAFCHLFDLNLFGQLYTQKHRKRIIVLAGWLHCSSIKQMLYQQAWNSSHHYSNGNILSAQVTPLRTEQLQSILQSQEWMAILKRKLSIFLNNLPNLITSFK